MGPEFWQTPMGRKFIEHTMPELVRQLGRLADLGERAMLLAEAAMGLVRSDAGTSQDDPSSGPASGPRPAR